MDSEKLLYQIVDRIGRTQDEMRDILTEMQADLKYHIRRTDILEDEIKRIEDRIPPPFPWKRFAVVISAVSTAATALIKVLIQL